MPKPNTFRRHGPGWRNVALGLATLVLATGCGATINEDIVVPEGATDAAGGMTVNGSIDVGAQANVPDAAFRTINGRIRIGEGAHVNDCATVNGRMDIGPSSETGTLQTVNGSIHASKGSRIDGEIRLVNGDVRLDPGTAVADGITTVNGEIEMRQAEVGGDLTNVNGDMLITDGSVVEGRLIVRSDDSNAAGERPRIVIGPESRVLGGLEFQRPVSLYVHDSAYVGEIVGADPIRFSGERPDPG